jgi:putative ABC transport system permease protein
MTVPNQMLWNIAIKTLVCDRGKLSAALVGVVFSVVLVNVQGGLFHGLMSKATLLVDRGNADIWVGNRGMHNVDFAHDIPIRWVNRIRSIDEVAAADPIRIRFSEMMLPDGKYEGVVIVGVDPCSELGRCWRVVEGQDCCLDEPHGVVVDKCDNDKLGRPIIGELREIGGHRARIVGKSSGMLSFLVTPYVFTTIRRAAVFCDSDPDQCSYLLVKLRPGADARDVCREIERRLPEVEAMTADQYAESSANFWTTRTGIGISFGASTVLGLLVGLVMVGQTLYAMVLDRIREFATLKAIGATEREIVTLLTAQSACVAAVGIAIGVVLTSVIRLLFSTPRASIEIPVGLYLFSAVLVFLICLIASGLPYLRVRSVDPHVVLQG